MDCSASGPTLNCGATSSTTRYWLDCVKMVEISRWPKALYSAVSMAETVTPSRLAWARSICTKACRPWSCRSLPTSTSSGRSCMRSTRAWVLLASCAMSGEDISSWYWVRATRSSMVRSCTGWAYRRMPGICSASSDRRRSTAGTPSRWPWGLRSISSRPVFSVVLLPSTPMKDEMLCTAGSLSSSSARACWRSAMAANEMDWSASVVAWMVPVSWSGKKPLGTAKYSSTVTASVARKTIHVRPRRSSTQVRMRP
ncbi:hypothetical protein DETS111669_16960 [Delftia tsuruhatensis]